VLDDGLQVHAQETAQRRAQVTQEMDHHGHAPV
jgi:hypothetical protein